VGCRRRRPSAGTAWAAGIPSSGSTMATSGSGTGVPVVLALAVVGMVVLASSGTDSTVGGSRIPTPAAGTGTGRGTVRRPCTAPAWARAWDPVWGRAAAGSGSSAAGRHTATGKVCTAPAWACMPVWAGTRSRSTAAGTCTATAGMAYISVRAAAAAAAAAPRCS
jgi:hypothetical protein